MKDPRFDKLASVLVKHSMKLKPGEKVLIESFDIPADFTVALVAAVSGAGAVPFVETYQQTVLRSLYQHATEDQMALWGQMGLSRMKEMDAYVGLRGSHNISEFGDVPQDKMSLYEKHYWRTVHSQRVDHTKWVVLRWPTPSMAQAAGMSTEAFEDFYFRVCADVDYAKMSAAMKPLHALLDRTERVHITGPGTDLKFSKKGIASKECSGDRNIPDGELFTCPVKDSVEGVITYNCETLYRGTVFNGVRLVFKAGKIVEATAGGETAKLNEILNADEGARYIGEWSLAFNPHILRPMKDILFDEKIAGSFHLTPGQAYEEAGNGNKSQIHWDMVCIQRPEYGGGEIHFDGKLVRKDGLFTLPELAGLNPDKLGT